MNRRIHFGMHSFAVLLLLSLHLSCATIISGTSQAVTVDSNVQGAKVTIDGNAVGVTPFTGKIKRQQQAVAVVSAPGYGSQPITLTTAFNPVAVLNVFWDYSTTDCLTGACWEYAPNAYYVDLKATGVSDARFRTESSLKAFTMTFHSDLMIELAAGNGPHLSALHREYFSQEPMSLFLERVQGAAHQDAVHFGEAVAALL